MLKTHTPASLTASIEWTQTDGNFHFVRHAAIVGPQSDQPNHRIICQKSSKPDNCGIAENGSHSTAIKVNNRIDFGYQMNIRVLESGEEKKTHFRYDVIGTVLQIQRLSEAFTDYSATDEYVALCVTLRRRIVCHCQYI